MSDVEALRFKKLLKKRGYFATRPRIALFILLQQHEALSVWQLIELLPAQDQATVYRNIRVFEELGIINRLRLGWHSKLELSDIFKHHHHHMTCTNCGRILVLKDNQLIEQQIQHISSRLSFLPTDHQLEIRGLCQACQNS